MISKIEVAFTIVSLQAVKVEQLAKKCYFRLISVFDVFLGKEWGDCSIFFTPACSPEEYEDEFSVNMVP